MVYKLFLILLLLQVHGATGGCFRRLLSKIFPCIETTECEGENYEKLSEFCGKLCTYKGYYFMPCIEKCMRDYKNFKFKNGATPEPIPDSPYNVHTCHFSKYPRKN